MTYYIGAACIDEMDRSCMEECPVDCIYEGERKLYINPIECIDCGNCLEVCPVQAVGHDRMPDRDEVYLLDNASFFTEVLPGREVPLGDPGGALNIGVIGVDTALVSSVETA